MKKLFVAELTVLAAGTLFAWTNFGFELAAWLKSRTCPTGCAAPGANPFLTPCFGGALFFTAALAICIALYRTWRKTPGA